MPCIWNLRKSILLTNPAYHLFIKFIPVFLPNQGNWKIQNDERYKFDQFHGIDLWLFFKNKFSEQFISIWNKENYQTFASIVWSPLKLVKIILKQKIWDYEMLKILRFLVKDWEGLKFCPWKLQSDLLVSLKTFNLYS